MRDFCAKLLKVIIIQLQRRAYHGSFKRSGGCSNQYDLRQIRRRKHPSHDDFERHSKEYGYIPLEVQEIVSDRTGISVAEIYGVVTFYSFFSLTPKGKYVIGCCLGTACYVKGAQQVIDKFSELLGIKPGETTKDGLFTIDALRCIGACGIAPAVSINGQVYPKVSVNAVPGIIDEYMAKEN